MIVTARQLEHLHRQNGANGRITLPYRSRLTPLAADWIRARKIELGYSDVETGNAPAPNGGGANAQATDARTFGSRPSAARATGVAATTLAASRPLPEAPILWWCDGPCGPAKAAVIAYEKESAVCPLDRPADSKHLVPAIKAIASEVTSGQAAGAVLLVQSGAMATVFANRCPSLRAVLGTCLESVDQGVQQVAANVLIIEYSRQNLQQMKNLLARFVRARRTVSADVERLLKELASCG